MTVKKSTSTCKVCYPTTVVIIIWSLGYVDPTDDQLLIYLLFQRHHSDLYSFNLLTISTPLSFFLNSNAADNKYEILYLISMSGKLSP